MNTRKCAKFFGPPCRSTFVRILLQLVWRVVATARSHQPNYATSNPVSTGIGDITGSHFYFSYIVTCSVLKLAYLATLYAQAALAQWTTGHSAGKGDLGLGNRGS